MKITVIGNGNIGSGLAKVLADTGYETTIAGRGDDLATAVADAALVVLATPFGAAADVAKNVSLSGKTVIDLSNPVNEDFSGLQVGHQTSSAEEIAKLFPEATVVKALNTIFAQHYSSGLNISGKALQTFVASDDEAAKQLVQEVASKIGLEPVDAGPLKNARYLEPLGFLNIQFGYVLGKGTEIAPQLLAA